MTTAKKTTAGRRLRAVEGTETANSTAEQSVDGSATQVAPSATTTPHSAQSHTPPQYNDHDARMWEGRTNEVLQAIQAQYGMAIPPQALEMMRVQAQALAAMRLLVNYCGIPEPVVQVAESQAMHQILSSLLIQTEAMAAQRGMPQAVRQPGIIVPGRN